MEGRLPSSVPAKASLGRKRGVLIAVGFAGVPTESGGIAILGAGTSGVGVDVGDGDRDMVKHRSREETAGEVLSVGSVRVSQYDLLIAGVAMVKMLITNVWINNINGRASD